MKANYPLRCPRGPQNSNFYSILEPQGIHSYKERLRVVEPGSLTQNEIPPSLLHCAKRTRAHLLLKESRALSAASQDADVPTWDENCVQGHHLHSMHWVSKGEIGWCQQRRWAGQPFSSGDSKHESQCTAKHILKITLIINRIK